MKLNGEDVSINFKISSNKISFTYGDDVLSMTIDEFVEVTSVIMEQIRLNGLNIKSVKKEVKQLIDDGCNVVKYDIVKDKNNTKVKFDLDVDKLNELRKGLNG